MSIDALPDAFLHVIPSGRFFSVAPSMSTEIIEMILDDVRYEIPRNWIHSANIPLGHDKLMLTLHATYPDLEGFTPNNQGVLPSGYMTDLDGWNRVALTAELVRGMRAKPTRPRNSIAQITEQQAGNVWRCDPHGSLWFDADGSPVIADQEHGIVQGWQDCVEAKAKGVFFRVRYGKPLVEHWRDIRARMSTILAGFVVDQ